jgi:glucokinase
MQGSHVLIGVDVGATTIATGVVTEHGDVLTALQAGTPRDAAHAAIEVIVDLVRRSMAAAAARALAVGGIGIGLPGAAGRDGAAGDHSWLLLPELSAARLTTEVSDATGLPTLVENDVNAQALAEWMFGVGRGAESLVLVAVGSGVGAGVILNGDLVRGKTGTAGELGNVPIDFDRRRPVVKELSSIRAGRGCLNQYLSGLAIAAEARERVACEPATILLARVEGDPRRITAQDVFEAASAGDEVSHRIVERACQALAAGIGIVVSLLNPEVVVVSGGLVRSLQPLRDEIMRRASDYAFAEPLAATRVHFLAGDKTREVRGGAAVVLYDRMRTAESAPAVPSGGRSAVSPRGATRMRGRLSDLRGQPQ